VDRLRVPDKRAQGDEAPEVWYILRSRLIAARKVFTFDGVEPASFNTSQSRFSVEKAAFSFPGRD